MSFLNGVIAIGIIDTILGVFIWLKQDFRLLPKKICITIKPEDRPIFIKNFGKGLALTGICILTACIDVFHNDILRWSLFGFTLAYSDVYLRKARGLAIDVKIKKSDNTVKVDGLPKRKSLNSKINTAIISSFVLGTVGLGVYIAVSFYTLINNKPFENFISTEEIVSASIYFSPIDETILLNDYQLNELFEILNDMIVYEEVSSNFSNGDAFRYHIEKNDGTVYQIKAMGNLLLISINDILYRYTIDEQVSEKIIFHAIGVK